MNSPDDDHIACELTETSLLQLRPRPEYPTLNEQDAEQLRGQVVQAIAQTTESSEYRDNSDLREKVKTFLVNLNKEDLVGLTRAQAQNKILQEIVLLQAPSPPKKDDEIVSASDPSLVEYRREALALNDHRLKAGGLNCD